MLMLLTADGIQQERGAISFDACCPDPLCAVDTCVLACSFIGLLPSGPMWDRDKTRALDYFTRNSGMNPCDSGCFEDESNCTTLVAYAVYLSRVLNDLLQNGLKRSIVEASPHTTQQTLDDWLSRLGWQDCFATQCRTVLGTELTPYEIMGECGPIFCPLETPAALQCAVKQGIVRALSRAQMGGIKNLAWLQWVIAPLGATIRPRNLSAARGVDGRGKPCCTGMQFDMCNVGDTLPICDVSNGCKPSGGTVQAFVRRPGSECQPLLILPDLVWPGVIAAECIIRSLLPPACPNNIFRCC